jgi:hypothetical protein
MLLRGLKRLGRLGRVWAGRDRRALIREEIDHFGVAAVLQK